MSCIFCKINNNEIPSTKIYEDDDILVILDLSQVTYGHTLVIPKKHYSDILDIEPELLAKMTKLTQKLCVSYKESLKCEGFNILNNCKEIAGQTIMHFHIHIIPRYKDDNVCFNLPSNQGKFNFNELVDIIKKGL